MARLRVGQHSADQRLPGSPRLGRRGGLGAFPARFQPGQTQQPQPQGGQGHVLEGRLERLGRVIPQQAAEGRRGENDPGDHQEPHHRDRARASLFARQLGCQRQVRNAGHIKTHAPGRENQQTEQKSQGGLLRHDKNRLGRQRHPGHAQQQPQGNIGRAPPAKDRVPVGVRADQHLHRRENIGQGCQNGHQGSRDGQFFDHHPVQRAVKSARGSSPQPRGSATIAGVSPTFQIKSLFID